MARYNQQSAHVDLPNERDLRVMLTGDMLESARLINQWGEKLGKAFASKEQGITSTQIRGLFGTARQIEMNWQTDENNTARRDMILLKPKLRYQAERHKGLEPLANLLSDAIDIVDQEDGIDAHDKYQRLMELFEAILAYFKAAGGK